MAVITPRAMRALRHAPVQKDASAGTTAAPERILAMQTTSAATTTRGSATRTATRYAG
jgi:hypothetical protein